MRIHITCTQKLSFYGLVQSGALNQASRNVYRKVSTASHSANCFPHHDFVCISPVCEASMRRTNHDIVVSVHNTILLSHAIPINPERFPPPPLERRPHIPLPLSNCSSFTTLPSPCPSIYRSSSRSEDALRLLAEASAATERTVSCPRAKTDAGFELDGQNTGETSASDRFGEGMEVVLWE